MAWVLTLPAAIWLSAPLRSIPHLSDNDKPAEN